MLKELLRLIPLLPGLILFHHSVNAYPLDSSSKGTTNPDLTNQNEAPPAAPMPMQLAAAIGAPPNLKKPIIDKTNPEIIFDDEKNLRLLELHIGKYNMQELIATYQYEDMTLVPFGLLSELIDLAINVNLENGTAEGFIFKEERTFNLDAKRGEVTISGNLTRFDIARLATREFDDIYIDSRLLSSWLPLKINIDLFASQLKIISDEPLPFEKRKLREEQIKYSRSRLQKTDRGYPLHEDPAKNWSYPKIDQTVRLGVFRNASGDFESNFSYATFATADLFQMESSWYLSGSNEELFDDSRVLFSKKDPNNNLLGAARASEYSFGHISEPSFDHVTRTTSSQPGLLVSSYPLTRQLEYDRHQFRGELLPGWEVELYRNNSLLDYRSVSDNGQYHFDDVPLLFGSNRFRLVFYGPQGQQREETYTFNLDSSLTEPGAHYYRASVMEDEDSGTRTVINYDLGINKKVSASFGFASIPIFDQPGINTSYKQHSYLKAGLRGFKDQFFYRTDFTKDLQSGSNLDWSIQTRINSILLRFGEAYFNSDFDSELFPASQISIERQTNIKVDAFIPSETYNTIPVSFEYNRDSYSSNIVRQRFLNRFSLSSYGYSFANTLAMNTLTDTDNIIIETMQLSSRKLGFNTRGVLNYLIEPESELTSVSVTVDGFKIWDYFVTAGLSRSFQSSTDTLTYSMNRSHGKYTLGATASYATGGILSANLTLSASIGREPRTGNWQTEYRPTATLGSVSTIVYLDQNNNGEKDADEKGLKDISLRINGGQIPQETDEQGIAYITGLETYRELDFDISVESLEDPLWNPSIKGKRLLLRPGHTTMIDFPVVVTGEIDGTVFASYKGKEQAVSGVIMEIVDLDGKIVQTTKSEYDGFYLFSKIPFATYTVRVSPEQVEQLSLEPMEPEAVTVNIDNQIINGIDLKLKKRLDEPERNEENGPDTEIQKTVPPGKTQGQNPVQERLP